MVLLVLAISKLNVSSLRWLKVRPGDDFSSRKVRNIVFSDDCADSNIFRSSGKLYNYMIFHYMVDFPIYWYYNPVVEMRKPVTFERYSRKIADNKNGLI